MEIHISRGNDSCNDDDCEAVVEWEIAPNVSPVTSFICYDTLTYVGLPYDGYISSYS